MKVTVLEVPDGLAIPVPQPVLDRLGWNLGDEVLIDSTEHGFRIVRVLASEDTQQPLTQNKK